MFNRNEIVELLRTSVINVTFTKLDGTDRTMECTLLPDRLPEEYRTQTPVEKEVVGNAISVWDVGVGGWRSFRVDSVKAIG